MGWRVPVAKPDIGEAEAELVQAVVRSGWISSGPRVRELEAAFARLSGTRFAVATNTGTAALHAALLALEVGPGDEVITTPLSCISSANPILFQGAVPVFADIEPETYNLDVADVGRRITSRTKAILPVHLFGHPVDMDPLVAAASRHGVPVIEDASQAAGSTYKGRSVGGLGTLGTFSLYVNKTVTTGEGGMVVTDDEALYHRLVAIRNVGQEPGHPFVHPFLGANYKMTDLHAAVGLAQVEKLPRYVAARRRNVQELNPRLVGLDRVIECVPMERPYATAAFFAYHMLFRTPVLRDRAEAAFHEAGVETRPFFSLISDQAPYRALGYRAEDTPRAADAFARGLYVSNSPDLTPTDKDLIVDVVRGLEER
jgi:perosamine synthetase